MYQTQNTAEKIRLFLSLFLPILIYQTANYSAGFIDTMMTGQYHTLDLAGVGMATSLWSPFFTFLTGIVAALVPMVSHHLGEGKQSKIASDLWQFIYMALLLGTLLFLLVLFGAGPALKAMGLEDRVFQAARGYLFYLMFGIPPLLLFSVFRSFFDALGLTRLSMYLMLLLLPLNSIFNYLLIYGKVGLPQMGGAGAGLGTSLAYWCLLGISILILRLHPKVAAYKLWKLRPFEPSGFKEGLQLGLPIGGSVFAEVGIFAAVGLWMAKFDSLVIASHQAAMNFSTLLYAFPFAVSSTMAIVVAYESGAGRVKDARAYSWIGRTIALGFAFVSLIGLYLSRSVIAGWYGSGSEFLSLTAAFLTYALCFQLGDAIAAPLQGILRGYKDTTIPFILMVVSYWAVPWPIGFYLDSVTNLGPFAYWIGLCSCIFVTGVLLQIRLWQVQRKQ